MKTTGNTYDVIIVGGGPAGLSAALVLGRCRRSVLLCDEGKPRNRFATAMHGYLSRDGLNPLKLLSIGRRELKRYRVEIKPLLVTKAVCRNSQAFTCTLSNGQTVRSRKLLLATGVVDDLPNIPGLRELYGKCVHHCPYCDGWEWRDHKLAALSRGKAGVALALKLKRWSSDVILCTNGAARLSAHQHNRLKKQKIEVRERKIAKVEGSRSRLKAIVFDDSSKLKRDAVFFATGQGQRSNLAAMLGCEFNTRNSVRTDNRARTSVPGLFLAGDASRDVQFVIVAAAEGAAAATTINKELMKEEGLA